MKSKSDTRSLRELLRDACNKRLVGAWLYLPDTDCPTLETLCVVLGHDAFEESAESGEELAVELGFPRDGLEVADLEGTAEWARQFSDPPPDELLLESFLYYWRFDAFLPEPGAGDPPPEEESRARMDRDFYESLGPERTDKPCREAGCGRGSVAQSVFCRVHHFEMMMRRECPLDD